MTRATLWRAELGALAACLALATPAGAATVIGQAPPATGVANSCGIGGGLQLASGAGPDYAVPANGVLTHWRSSLTGTVEFRVYRGSGTLYTAIAGDLHTVNGTLTQFDARIPVQAGDRIGIQRTAMTNPGCLYATGNGSDQIGSEETSAIGTPITYAPASGMRFNVAADVEPDADADGFGDETQDLCPTDAATQGACPDRRAPEATLRKKPKRKGTKRRAKFKFSSDEPGSTFKCALDEDKPEECTSPFKQRVGLGKHTFELRVTDPAGNTGKKLSYRWKVLEK